MKIILIPYDFSESAITALQYSIGFANEISAELVLLSVNSYPVMGPEMGLSAFSYQDAKEDTLKELQKISENVTGQNPGIKVTCHSELGELNDEIKKLSKKMSVELIIMGISGHGSQMVKSLIGSTAVSVSNHIEVPVLVVPPGAMYVKPSRMAFTCKYGEEQSHHETLDRAKQFSQLFNADLHMVHLIPDGQSLKHTEVMIDDYSEHHLEESVHRTFIITEKKVTEGILGMLKNNLVDLIIIEPKKHNFFEKLFHQSTSTEIAFTSPVPVLMIH